ncbi:uncharacterized protein LOC129596940 [Paramacrobiotus metropolitanus]|uniref:uncharacterized protein LOC129596940 n=1 Tax=Paramacrobiotus metropolitanus TaxID=2943436 RepID=UPI002445BFB1|nr:uncharacterized protein LOC129596940 [Paramacrobiotus metropolitanus]
MNISSITGNLSATIPFRRRELIAIISLNGIAAITGTVLSMTLFLTILLRPQLRTGSGILIAHHQLLHMLHTGYACPFYIVSAWAVWLGVSIAGLNCTVLYCLTQLIVCSETWNSLFLAFNRFIALIYPHQYRHISSNAAIAGFIVAAWSISLAMNVPGVFGIGGYFGKRQVDCGFIRVTNDHLYNAVGIISKHLPIALQAVLYGIILFHHYRARNGVQEIGYAGSPVFLLLMNKDAVNAAKEGIRRVFCRAKSGSVSPNSVVSSKLPSSRP